MSPGDYVVWLVKHGCGYLGWTVDQVLDEDMTNVALALEGRVKLLEQMSPYGGAGQAAERPKPKPTGAEIISFARAHNRLKRAGMMKAAG
jgi:hypothetical protein